MCQAFGQRSFRAIIKLEKKDDVLDKTHKGKVKYKLKNIFYHNTPSL